MVRTKSALGAPLALLLALLSSACGDESTPAEPGAEVARDASSARADDNDPPPATTDIPRDPARATDAGTLVRDAGPRAVIDAALPAPAQDAVADAAGATSSTDASTGASTTPDCDRACLIAVNTSYLEALVAKDAKRLKTATGVRFTENGKELPLTDGLWAVASKLRGYRQDWIEPGSGQSGGFVALDDEKGAVLLAFRLKVVAQAVTELETIVARQGEATFFSPNNLTTKDPVFDEIVEPAQRASREQMIATVDLYFQALDSGDGSKIPVDERANRNENGVVTASGTGIRNVSMFSYIEEIKRRYVIVDEERGQVLSLVLFEIPRSITGGSRTLHLAEAFKVQGGKIRNILAFMVNQPLGTPSGWN